MGDSDDAWHRFTLCLKSARLAGQSGVGLIRKCKQRLRSLAASGHVASQSAASKPPSKSEWSRRLPSASSGKAKLRQKGTVMSLQATRGGGRETTAAISACSSSSSEGDGSDSGSGSSSSSSSSSVDSASVASERERKAATPCRNWANFGSCQHGSGCHFSHQLAAAAAAAPQSETPRPPCRNWASGSCKFGRLCHYSHDSGAKQ